MLADVPCLNDSRCFNPFVLPVFSQLAQLMADLQKMPGGAGFLKKQTGKQKTKERGSVSTRW